MCITTFDRTSTLALNTTQNSFNQIVPMNHKTVDIDNRSSDYETPQQRTNTNSCPISIMMAKTTTEKDGKKGILRVKTVEDSLKYDLLSKYDVSFTGKNRPRSSESTISSSSFTCLSSLTFETASSNSYTSRSNEKERRSVSFSDITIREYNGTVGDNPSCSKGAPISLHWSYKAKHISCSVDLYEKSKENIPPRTREEMILPMSMRHSLLREEWNVSTSEILRVIKENKIIQEQRYKSSIQSDRRVRAKSLIANAKCSLRRLVSKGT
jgi:hypothetical protein